MIVRPNFLIIGAQKAGTTTLFDMLNNLKGFSGSKIKEPGFFSKDKFYRQGEGWYQSNFASSGDSDITFEATPAYLYFDYVPERIFRFNPDMKFVVLLREPAARCFSAWNMFRSFHKNNPDIVYEQFSQHANPEIREAMKKLLFADKFPSFRDAVQEDLERISSVSPSPEPSFVRRGLYYSQLMNYLKYFDMANFLFLEQSELDAPQDVLDKIARFLNVGIDSAVIEKKKSNTGIYEPILDEDARVILHLKDFYRPHNERLFGLIGKRYAWND